MQVTSSGGGGLAGFNGESAYSDKNAAPRRVTVTSVTSVCRAPTVEAIRYFHHQVSRIYVFSKRKSFTKSKMYL